MGTLSFIVDRVILMDIALLLMTSYLFMTGFDVVEIQFTEKEILEGKGLLILDAVVADKPVLKSQNKKEKTQAIDFEDRMGKRVHRSLKLEDWRSLEVGEEVFLIYRGKKRCLSVKKACNGAVC